MTLQIQNAHNIKPDGQLFTQSAEEMRCLALPLKKYGIEHFAYQVIHGQSTFEVLTTHPNFSQLFIDEKFYKLALSGEPNEYTDGFVLGDDLRQPEILQTLAQTTGITNGIMIIKTNGDLCEVYYFGSPASSGLTQSFYVNNLPFLEQFIRYFKKEAKDLLQRSSNFRLHYPNSNDSSVLTRSEWKNNNLLTHHFREFANQDDVFTGYKLTATERELVEILKLGLSTKVIAHTLHRSPRTIEIHIDNIKRKFGCKSKYHLVCQLMTINSTLKPY